MEADNLPSKIPGNLIVQKNHSTVKPEICTQAENLPDTLILTTFMGFLKTQRICYTISEDQFILQHKIHFAEINSLTGMTDSMVSPW